MSGLSNHRAARLGFTDHHGQKPKISDNAYVQQARQLNGYNPIMGMVKELDCNFSDYVPGGCRSVMKYTCIEMPGRLNRGNKRLVAMVGNSWCAPEKITKILNVGRTGGHDVRGTHVYNSGVNYSVFCFGPEVSGLFVTYDDDTKQGTCVLWANVQSLLGTCHEEADEHNFWTVSFTVDDEKGLLDWGDYAGVSEDGLPGDSEMGSAVAGGVLASEMLTNFLDNSWFCRTSRYGTISTENSLDAASQFILKQVVQVARDDRFEGTKVHAQFFDADLRNEDPPKSEPTGKQRIIFDDSGNIVFCSQWGNEEAGISSDFTILTVCHQIRYDLPKMVSCAAWYNWTPCIPGSGPIRFYDDITRFVETPRGELVDIKDMYIKPTNRTPHHKPLRKKVTLKAMLDAPPVPDRPLNKLRTKTFWYPADEETKDQGRHFVGENPDPRVRQADKTEGAWVSVTVVHRFNPFLPGMGDDMTQSQHVKLQDGKQVPLQHDRLESDHGNVMNGAIVGWRETDYTNLVAGCPSIVKNPEAVLGSTPRNYGAAKWCLPERIHDVNTTIENKNCEQVADEGGTKRRIYGRGMLIEKAIMLGCKTVDASMRDVSDIGKALTLDEGVHGSQRFKRLMGYDIEVIYQAMSECCSTTYYRIMHLIAGSEDVEAYQLGNIAPDFQKQKLTQGLHQLAQELRRDIVQFKWECLLAEFPLFEAKLKNLQRDLKDHNEHGIGNNPIKKIYRMEQPRGWSYDNAGIQGSGVIVPAPGGLSFAAAQRIGAVSKFGSSFRAIAARPAPSPAKRSRESSMASAAKAAKKEKTAVSVEANKQQVPKDVKTGIMKVFTASQKVGGAPPLLKLFASIKDDKSSAFPLCNVADILTQRKALAPLLAVYQCILAAQTEEVSTEVSSMLLSETVNAIEDAFAGSMGKSKPMDAESNRLVKALAPKSNLSEIIIPAVPHVGPRNEGREEEAIDVAEKNEEAGEAGEPEEEAPRVPQYDRAPSPVGSFHAAADLI